ncbi:MAG: alkene reductase [Hyphomicrobiales bacterium]|nr:alkene reductase [Hyphomicrobiales bacterium]
MTTLFDSADFGALHLKNRIVLAPLTRCRAGEGRVPTALMGDYYVQRASAGLMISEATSVTPMGVGYPDTPGIWSAAQIDAWRKITTRVHEAGGTMVLQLWHVGRISDPGFLDGALPVAPSALAPQGHVAQSRPKKPYVTPRALELAEIPGVIAAFAEGAENARKAGFDGVEIHGANGYLLDQFLHDGANHRRDAYGGSIENRARLLLEVTDAVVRVWGAERVGMHLNLMSNSNDVTDSNPAALFGYVAEALAQRRLAFLFGRDNLATSTLGRDVRRAFGGAYIANDGLDAASAAAALADGRADAAAFGRLFIANPDLVARFARNAPLNELNAARLYGGGGDGYTDYPVLEAADA